MTDFDPRLYGARWAEFYDEWHEGLMDNEGAVAVIAELGGPVLELAVGTGRLAIPLAERGLEVVGVDISEEMLAQLRAKPGAERVETIVGDMTTVRLDREFDVVLLAYSSLFVLGTQEAQVQLFRNAADHLRPGGRFVLETWVVEAPSGGTQQRLVVSKIEPDRMILTAGLLDPVTSFYNGTWVVLGPSGAKFYPIQGRHVSHHEMDLMAQLAGFELEDRWGDWKRGPFTAQSRLHVSIYRKPVPPA